MNYIYLFIHYEKHLKTLNGVDGGPIWASTPMTTATAEGLGLLEVSEVGGEWMAPSY